MDIQSGINKSVFLIGAGASHDTGCKMSGQMFEAIKELICSKSNDIFSEVECETVKFLLSCLHYHSEWRTLEVNRKYPIYPNIEELALLIRRVKNREHFLPYPITGNWADKLIRLEAKFKEENDNKIAWGLFDKLEDTIKNKLIPEWLSIGKTEFLEPLDKFFSDCNKSDFTLELFSLNYDLVFEQHYSQQKAAPYRGFYSGEWRGFGEKPNNEEFNRINLYKLHGSLDWIRLNDGSVLERKYKGETEENEDGENRIEHDPFIIFGHGSKFFSVEPFFSLIQELSKKLKERSYIFVIGYSFFDPYINNLLIQAVKEAREENKKIIIVNPSFASPLLNDKHFIVDSKLGVEILSDTNAEGKKLLTEYLEDIQRNIFYSELPEFNIKQIPTESLVFLRVGTAEFLEKFFNNSGENLIKLIEEFEKERSEDLPF